MAVSRERFAQGLTAAQFIEQMTRNREKCEENLAAADALITADDIAFFSQHPVSIVAIAEDWCTDVVQFLPPVIRLAEKCPEIDLRIFLRDQNHDLIDQYLKQGKFRSIPVFIFYDGAWNELGYLIERPDEVTAEMAQETRRFALAQPEIEGINRSYENMPDETRKAVSDNSRRYRWSNMQRWNRIFLDQARDVVAGESRARESAVA